MAGTRPAKTKLETRSARRLGPITLRRVDDRAGHRLDPDEAILDGSDPGHVLGGDAQRVALLFVENDAVETDDPVGDGNRQTVARDPRDVRQLGEDALADLIVAGGRARP